jgi:hypothetical protein
VNADGKSVGVLTLDDILMQFAIEFQHIGALIESETPKGVASASHCLEK